MKSRLLLSALVLSIMALSMLSCKKSSAEIRKDNTQILLSQPWAYNNAAINAIAEKMSLTGQEWNTIQETLSRLEGATFRFLEDNTLVLQVKSGQELRGSWDLTQDGNSLIMQPTPATVMPQEIGFISKDSLYLIENRELGFIFPKILKPVPVTTTN